MMSEMTQAAPIDMIAREQVVPVSLATLGRRRQAVSACAAAVRLAWMGGLALLAVVLADASVTLPASVRLLSAMGVVAVIAAAAARWRRRPGEPGEPGGPGAAAQRRLAREVELQAGVPHNQLVNALLLGGAARGYGDPLAQALARRSAERGAAALRGLDMNAAVDRERLRREGGWLWAVAVAWMVVAVIQPGVVGQGLARVALPWADVPAFSLTRLVVTVEPGDGSEAVMVGDDVRVTAAVSGVMPAEPATLVTLSGSAGAARRWTMREADEGRWVHTLRDLREPVRFRVEAGAAWSRAYVVRPMAARDEAEEAEEVAQPGTVEAVADAGADATAGDDDMAAQVEALRALMQQAAAIRDLAEAMAAASELDAATWQAMLEALRGEIEAFAGDAGALADELEAMAASLDEPMQSEAKAMADVLRGLALPAMAEMDLQPSGKAEGMPANEVREAAEADRATLAERGAAMAAMADGRVSREEGAGALPAAWADPAAEGTYDVQIASGDVTPAQLRAMMEQAPPAYRTLVERYFRSLSEEVR